MPLDDRTKSDLKRAVWQEPARWISFAEQSLRRIVMGHPSIPRTQTLHGKFEHWRRLCQAEIDLLFNAGSTSTMQQRLVRSGEFFEGNLILRRIFESARTHIDVIDPYVGARLLALLSVKNDAVHIRIIHNSSRAKPADIQALKDFKRQCSNVEIRALQDDLHDRTKKTCDKEGLLPDHFSRRRLQRQTA
jgi:glycerophosphoryl diester phosphodiesterase